MNYWLDDYTLAEEGYFCIGTVYPYEGDISGIVSFDIEELSFNMPVMWKFLNLKPGCRYSVGVGAFHFLDPNYNPKAGDKIKIGLIVVHQHFTTRGYNPAKKRTVVASTSKNVCNPITGF